jgi:hypothetical protein
VNVLPGWVIQVIVFIIVVAVMQSYDAAGR